MTDFELGLRKALRTNFPNVELFSCWFHYTQAIRKKSGSIQNFLIFLKKNKTADKIYHKFLALPLLPASCINEIFHLLKEEIESLENKEHFDTFLNYFEKQWLQRVSYNKFLLKLFYL